MRKGKARIVVGVIMIVLQVMSSIGNSYNDGLEFAPAQTSGQLLFDVGFWIGSHFVGLIGALLLIWGIVAFIRSKNRTDNNDDCYEYFKSEGNKEDIYKR